MELDAFTGAVGTRQGRLRRDTEHVLVLGDVEPRRLHPLSEGDYVEWAQEVDLTDETVVRLQGSLHTPKEMPAGLGWEVSVTVGDEKRARLLAAPGRTLRVDDLAAYVGDIAGRQRVAVRLELVRTNG